MGATCRRHAAAPRLAPGLNPDLTARIYNRSIFYDSPHFFIGGVLAFVLAIAAYEVSVKTFVSVWCFFAS